MFVTKKLVLQKKKKKCQPAAGDMADLIKTAHVPSSRLARPQIKISKRKKQNQKNTKQAGKQIVGHKKTKGRLKKNAKIALYMQI